MEATPNVAELLASPDFNEAIKEFALHTISYYYLPIIN